jgi:hypothetical protein
MPRLVARRSVAHNTYCSHRSLLEPEILLKLRSNRGAGDAWTRYRGLALASLATAICSCAHNFQYRVGSILTPAIAPASDARAGSDHFMGGSYTGVTSPNTTSDKAT